MRNSVSNTVTSESAAVEKLQVYLNAIDGVVEVYQQAEAESQAWSRARCNAILADCRKRFCCRLRRLGQDKLTDWEHGFAYVLDDLWNTINPVSTTDSTELIHRVQKVGKVSSTLKTLLAALMSMEVMYPAGSEIHHDSCMESELVNSWVLEYSAS